MTLQFESIQIDGEGELAGLKSSLQQSYNGFYSASPENRAGLAFLLRTFWDADSFALVQKQLGSQYTVTVRVSNPAASMVVRRRPEGAIQGKVQFTTGGEEAFGDDQGLWHALVDTFEFPSNDDYVQAMQWSSPLPTGQPAAQDPLANASREELVRELQSLQEEKMMMGSMDHVQTQADDLQNSLFEINKELEKYGKVIGQYEDLHGYLQERSDVVKGGKALAERAKNYDSMQVKFESQTNRHEQKRDALLKDIQRIEQTPTWIKDVKLIGSTVVFFGCLIASSILKNQFVAIPAVLAIGAIGYLVYTYIQMASQLSVLNEKLDKEKGAYFKIKRSFDEAVAMILQLQRKYKLLQERDVANLYDEVRERQKLFEQWQQEYDIDELRKNQATLEKEQVDKQSQYDKISGALQDASGGMMGLKEISARIEELEGLLRGEQRVAAAIEISTVEPNPADAYANVLSGLARVSRIVDYGILLDTANKTLESWSSLLGQVGWHALVLQEDGIFIERKPGNRSPLSEGSIAQQGMGMLLARIAMWLNMPQERRFPVLIEGRLDEFDDDQAGLILKLLSHASKQMQIMHMTTKRSYAPKGKSIDFGSSTQF